MSERESYQVRDTKLRLDSPAGASVDYEVFESPLEDFKEAVAGTGFEEQVKYVSHSEMYRFEVPASRQ
jgi:hypothetical protein